MNDPRLYAILLAACLLVTISGSKALGEPGPPELALTPEQITWARNMRAQGITEFAKPDRLLTEDEILTLLAQLKLPRSSRWYELVSDLGRIGGQRALEYLLGQKADLDPRSDASSGEAEHLQRSISRIGYRQFPADQQGAVLVNIISSANDPAFDWAIDEVGDQGIKAALPRIEALIEKSSGTEQAWFGLVRRKILAQVRHGRPMAYLVASRCAGDGETAEDHARCEFKIWGYKKLGTVQSPDVIKYLQTALRETEREYEEHLRQKSQTAGLIRIEDKSQLILYYDAIYEALKGSGGDPGPRHSRMVIDY